MGRSAKAVADNSAYPTIEIAVPDNRARVLRLRQLGTTDKVFWSIHELQVLERATAMQARLEGLEIPAKFASDLAVAKALCVAARAGVLENVNINLDSIQDDALIFARNGDSRSACAAIFCSTCAISQSGSSPCCGWGAGVWAGRIEAQPKKTTLRMVTRNNTLLPIYHVLAVCSLKLETSVKLHPL